MRYRDIVAYTSFDLDAMPRREGYPLFLTAVVPRPIGWISTISPSGVRNAAPFSWFNAVCAKPYLLVVAVARQRDGSPKDTSRNARDTGEFVVNIVGEGSAPVMVQSSAEYPPDVDEFSELGLTAVESESVKPPRIGESPIHLECELERTIDLGEGAVDLLFGRVRRMHAAPGVLAEDGRVDAERLRPVARLGRDEYAVIDRVVRHARPAVPSSSPAPKTPPPEPPTP